MNLLKGLALGILSFLLVLSLSVFGVAFLVKQTILNPGFVSSELNKLDVPQLAEEFLSEQIPEEMLTDEVLSDIITDLEPWIQEQVTDGVYTFYEYLTGESESLSVVVSLEPVKESLRDYVSETTLQSIPSTFELNEASLSPQLSANIELVREYIGYFQVGYIFLIGFMLLLIVGIVAIAYTVNKGQRIAFVF